MIYIVGGGLQVRETNRAGDFSQLREEWPPFCTDPRLAALALVTEQRHVLRFHLTRSIAAPWS
jgi:hypothetical protein